MALQYMYVQLRIKIEKEASRLDMSFLYERIQMFPTVSLSYILWYAAPTQIPLTKLGHVTNMDVSKAKRYSDPIEMGCNLLVNR